MVAVLVWSHSGREFEGWSPAVRNGCEDDGGMDMDVNQPTYTVPASIVGSLDYRVQFDSQLRELKDTPDPYAASRRNYLEGRQAESDALHGRTSPQPITRLTLPVFP